MAAANSIEFGMPVFDPTAMDGSQSAIKLVKEDLLQKHSVLPLYKRGGKLFVGTADPKIGRASCRESVSVRVDLGGRRIIKKNKKQHTNVNKKYRQKQNIQNT